MRVLLSHRANINAIDFGDRALHRAAKNGKADVISVLLAHGAPLNANYCGWTTLYDAAENGHVDAIQVLLAHGADFDEEDRGWPALQTPVKYSQGDVVRVLLAHRAEVDGEDSGGTVLCEAPGSPYSPRFRKGRPSHVAIVCRKIHVDHMADVHEGPKSWTHLRLARTNNHRDTMTVLIACRSNIVSQTRATADMASG